MSRKEAELDHMLLLNINRKAYMGSPMTLSHLTLTDVERSKSSWVGVRVELQSLRHCHQCSEQSVPLWWDMQGWVKLLGLLSWSAMHPHTYHTCRTTLGQLLGVLDSNASDITPVVRGQF